jgi:hypothetical protein
MHGWQTALLWLLAGSIGGCGQNAAQVVAENRAYFDELRPKLAAVARAVEAAPAGATGGRCEPEAKLDADADSASFNLDLLQLEQLADIDVDLKGAGRAIELDASPALERCLRWTGPKSKLDSDASGAAVAQSFARCRQVSHLLVARERAHDRATAELRMRYDLVRLSDAKVLCGFELLSKGDPSLGVLSYEIKRPGSDEVVKSERRDEYASALASAAREELKRAAEEKLGLRLPLP